MAEPYSRAWNFGIAKNILRYLPRELSDMIQNELSSLYHPDPKNNDEFIHYRKAKMIVKHIGTWSGNRRAVTVYPRVTVEEYPHYFNQAFMGPEFFEGLSKIFHAERRFYVPGLPDLTDFLSKDRFGTSCIPSDHIMYLEIDISLSSLNTTTDEYRTWRSPKYERPIKLHFEKVAKALQILRTLRYRHGAKLSLVIDCDRFDNAEKKFAEVLYPLVYDMKQIGWTVEVDALSTHQWGSRHAMFDYNVTRGAWDDIARNDSAFVSRTGESFRTLLTSCMHRMRLLPRASGDDEQSWLKGPESKFHKSEWRIHSSTAWATLSLVHGNLPLVQIKTHSQCILSEDGATHSAMARGLQGNGIAITSDTMSWVPCRRSEPSATITCFSTHFHLDLTSSCKVV
jgi:hypothetical protein